MKLYYLLISIFCIRLIGLSYFLTLLFLGNLFFHLLDRLPVYINMYPDILVLRYIDEKYQNISNSSFYNNNYSNIFDKITSSNLLVPLINIYNKAEYFYLIFIDETLLMFGNLAFKTANKLMSSKFNNGEIKEINYKENLNNEKLLIDSSSDEDESILNKIKKQNNIKSKNKFDKMTINDLNNMNNVLSTLTSTLNTIVSDIKVEKEKTI